ncbi:UNVERIFIED_ORG: hypothetical protein GGR78_003308 [Xanthomonas campestris]
MPAMARPAGSVPMRPWCVSSLSLLASFPGEPENSFKPNPPRDAVQFRSSSLMRYLATLLLIFLSSSAAAAVPQAWLERVPDSAGSWRNWTAIPESVFFEVPGPMLPNAEALLADAAFLAQEQSDMASFGRPDFACPAATRPFLLRAAYINHGTGRFGLDWAGSMLIVSHASLGPGGPPGRSALVACLSQAPSAVFSSLSGAI